MDTNELLSIKNLSVKLQNKVILSDTNLTLYTGEILGLVGPSGCGKTTLLNTIAGFNLLNTGEIKINSPHTEVDCNAFDNVRTGNTITHNDVLTITPAKNVPPEHRNIGMIFQDYALFPHLSVEKNICFGIDSLPKKEQKSRMEDLLHLLKLTGLENRLPHQLSGGQQQRVAIARALALQPKLLLLDEPFSNIDARLRNALMLEMRQLLKQLNISAIFVTHNKDEVFTFADQIAVMHEGSILQTGSPAAVCQLPNSWQVADFLQLGSWIPAQLLGEQYQTAIGNFSSTAIPISTVYSTDNKNNLRTLQLLLKPQFVEYHEQYNEKNSTLINTESSTNKKAMNSTVNSTSDNVKVDNIAVTEQGFHYLLSSINTDSSLAFKQLSFYSDILLALGDTLSIKIKPHEYQFFEVI